MLVADDHAIMREGIATVLARQPDMTVVAESADGPGVIELHETHRPDITLLDLRMPGGLEGHEIITLIRRRDPEARVVVLTTFDTDDDILSSLRAGAKAYLLKDTPPADLAACVRAVYAGQNWVSPAVAAKLAAQVSQTPLTARELDVLRLIAVGKMNKEIGAELSIAEGTVKAYTNSLFTKLSVQTRTEAVASAIRRGLVRIR